METVQAQPERPTRSRGADPLWAGVDRLLDRMDLQAVLAHELAPLAARRWRTLGRDVPPVLAAQERVAQLAPLMALSVLGRARAAYDGRMVVFKGPEIEARYPDGGRFFGDLDILVDDPPAALDALLDAGFERLPNARERRPVHLNPIHWPGSGLPVELHIRPNWPRHLDPPPTGDVFDQAVRSELPVDGLEAPAPAHHALIVAAHGWKHMPLRSARDLLDAALLAREADPEELAHWVERWKMPRLWRTVSSAAAWLFEDGDTPLAARLWARHLREPREASILEKHVRRWVTPFWMLPPGPAAVAAVKNVAVDAQPVGDESWRDKLGRIAWVAAHPRKTRSERFPQHAELDEF